MWRRLHLCCDLCIHFETFVIMLQRLYSCHSICICVVAFADHLAAVQTNFLPSHCTLTVCKGRSNIVNMFSYRPVVWTEVGGQGGGRPPLLSKCWKTCTKVPSIETKYVPKWTLKWQRATVIFLHAKYKILFLLFYMFESNEIIFQYHHVQET